MARAQTECTRCLLSDNIPGVMIYEDGTCSVCKQWDKSWGDWESKRRERHTMLERIFNDCRHKKRPYDVLVPLSGGRDSTYILYLARKRFNLKCLSVTFDNGFLTDHAKENIKRTVDILGVDHIYWRIKRVFLMRLYRLFFLTTGFFCPVCMRGIDAAAEMTAKKFNIPLILYGTSRRTEEYIAPEYFIGGSLSFFKEVLKNTSLENEVFPLLYHPDWKRMLSYNLFHGLNIKRIYYCARINLPDYFEWNYNEIYQTIINELDWKAHKEEAEHTDCKVDNIVNYIRQRKFPVLIPEKLRYSKLVTAGIMNKEEALQKIVDSPREAKEPNNLHSFLHMFDINREQFEEVISDPFRHMKLIKEPGSRQVLLESIAKARAHANIRFPRL